jgi:phosphate/sulfate permease
MVAERVLVGITIAIVIVLLGTIIAQGVVVNGIVSHSGNQQLQVAISVLVIILMIILFGALVYLAYALTKNARKKE